MRVTVLPTFLLAALLLVGAYQVHDALTHRPELILERGLPVDHLTRDAPPDAPQEPCRLQSGQLVNALPEIVGAQLDPEAPWCPCDSDVTLEIWVEGRFVWRPGRTLTLETW